MREAVYLVPALLISACTTDVKELLPQDGPTMVEIYQGHLQKAGGSSGPPGNDVLATIRREAAERAGQTTATLDPVSYTRTAENEIDNLFPTLENPAMVMHVFPHLATDERLPVPGYSTSFPLFERDEFALPGEAAEPAAPRKAKPKIRIIGGSGNSKTPSIIRTF